MSIPPIRLGISSCLLGHPVRYDGGHKRADHLVSGLSYPVEWVPVCPEVEAGLGVPREPMRLVVAGSTIHLITIDTRQDMTNQVAQFSVRRVRELKSLHLSGFVLKARSPSCGIEQVPLYDEQGLPQWQWHGPLRRCRPDYLSYHPHRARGASRRSGPTSILSHASR